MKTNLQQQHAIREFGLNRLQGLGSDSKKRYSSATPIYICDAIAINIIMSLDSEVALPMSWLCALEHSHLSFGRFAKQSEVDLIVIFGERRICGTI
jgi:hypothetical protein